MTDPSLQNPQGSSYPQPQQPYGQQGYPAAGYPAAPGYPSQGYGGIAAPPKNNTMAIVSLVLGIAGLTIVPGVASVVAVILGHIGLKQINERNEGGRGMAIGGLVMGYIGAIGMIIGIIVLIAFLPFYIQLFTELFSSYQSS